MVAAAIQTRLTDVIIADAKGEVIFRADQVEVPSHWKDSDIKIVTQKYLHPKDQNSLVNMIDRVCGTIAAEGLARGYFQDDEAAVSFGQELMQIILDQKAAWNSPVWFNVGIEKEPQCWACLILRVDDDMHGEHGIKKWIETEADCFLGGSGVGANLSNIRGDGEPLRSGKGVASGPISFMRWADQGAGSIKSGGRTRRAAKMVMLDADHPDILEFVSTKETAERMAHVLSDAGFDIALNGKDAPSIPFQNANNSVRVSDEFMLRVADGKPFAWQLRPRLNPNKPTEIDGYHLWSRIVEAAWACADPGLQFDDTINSWHTTPNFDRINGSNPCSEYMHVDDTVCNLSSLNLKKFWNRKLGKWELRDLLRTVEMMITSMDILVDLSSYPTDSVRQRTLKMRNLGIGFTNLGATLMSRAIPYDSDEGRAVAGTLMYFIQGVAARTSSKLANQIAPYEEWENNKEQHRVVLHRHKEEPLKWIQPYLVSQSDRDLLEAATRAWTDGWLEDGAQRNAQLSVIAPTGTISFLMGAETTGIEPVFALEAIKDLVGGGIQDVSTQECVREGLEILTELGFSLDAALAHPAFHTAMDGLAPEAHVRMMAAVQPSVSGAISKTVNLPKHATTEDVASIYKLSWELGLKAVAVYRDESKSYQPLSVKGADTVEVEAGAAMPTPYRRKLPYTHNAIAHKFELGEIDFYLHVGFYPDGKPGEIFLKASQEGGFVSGMIDSFATAVSLGLQYGVPLEKLASKFIHRQFEPQGFVTSDSDIKLCRSVVDYVFRWLTWNETEQHEEAITAQTALIPVVVTAPHGISGEPCPWCSKLTLRWAGSCRRCTNCSYDEGCG